MSSAPRWHSFGLACALSLAATAAQADAPAEAGAVAPEAVAPEAVAPEAVAPAAVAPAAVAPAALRATPPGAKVSAGQLLADDKAFVAGPEGATLDLIEGATLRLDPGTKLRFGRTFKMALGARPDDLVPTRVLMLDSGWMEATLLGKQFALFVEAPRKLRSILLAGSITAIASEPRSTVALAQGNALVALDDGWKWKHLSEGSMQIVSDVRPDGYRRSILAALDQPALSHSLLLSAGGDSDSTVLSWTALPQAINYEVQLHSGETLVRSVRTKELRVALSELPPGQYQAQVRGQDDSGIYGPFSPPAPLNVIGLEIPKTASRGPNGSVRLQPNQRITLIGAEGLEVAYLGLDDFLPAPKSVGLVARRPISLVLRHPASGETTRLDLEPLTVHAQISFARQPQGWPSDGLELAVKLVDDKGEPVPENFVVSCKVTVNIEPAQPSWERTGSVMRARLARPLGAAPWMVRVDVLDENGASLGRDFTEVGYAPAAASAHAQR